LLCRMYTNLITLLCRMYTNLITLLCRMYTNLITFLCRMYTNLITLLCRMYTNLITLLCRMYTNLITLLCKMCLCCWDSSLLIQNIIWGANIYVFVTILHVKFSQKSFSVLCATYTAPRHEVQFYPLFMGFVYVSF